MAGTNCLLFSLCQRFASLQYTPDNAELQPAAQLGGAAEPAAPDDAMLETLGDAVINTMERDNGDIEDSGVIVGGSGEMDNDAYELIEALEAKKRSNKNYVWAEEPTGGSTGWFEAWRHRCLLL